MKMFLAAAALALVSGCSARHPQTPGIISVDDAQAGISPAHFQYSGQWQHIRGHNDGRSNGTSSRSRHAGDTVIFPFNGSSVRVFGVRGPNGGNASVAIDGQYYGVASFYSPRKQVHIPVFQSPALEEGDHVLGLVVNGDPRGSHRLYVNVDDAEILHRQ